jgi:hypothetical protein
MTAHGLLPGIRDLYSRLPETVYLEPWEMVTMLWLMNCTDELEDEAVIAAAMDVARTDMTGERAPAVALKGGVPRSYAEM